MVRLTMTTVRSMWAFTLMMGCFALVATGMSEPPVGDSGLEHGWGHNLPAAGRDLIPFFHRLEQGQPTTLAAIGGSITMARTGWFDRVVRRLRAQYPNALIQAFNAGVAGTGSDLAVFRLRRDVISHDPDLVFIEFSVNDNGQGDAEVIRNLETMVVRHIANKHWWSRFFSGMLVSKRRDAAFRVPFFGSKVGFWILGDERGGAMRLSVDGRNFRDRSTCGYTPCIGCDTTRRRTHRCIP